MRLKLGLAIIACLLASPVFAAAIWQGRVTITGQAGACPNYNPVGNHYVARFQPRNLSDNGTNSRFAWFSDDYAQSFQLDNASFDTTWRAVQFTSIWTDAGSPPFTTSVRFLSQAPATILVNTNFINVVGQIANYDFQQGCIVTFLLSLTRSPTEG
jgi:hypothetical protein